MIVVISAAAEADLEGIGDWIAEDSPNRAVSFVREMRERCLSLANFPTMFPLVPRYEHMGFRRRPYGDYLIFYRVGEDVIDIVRIIHGARDYETILFPTE
jgi:plasmid stabilization system protein ParE